ncbi:hypothetical protein CDAR_395121 [Caerostris darwini]|uniref:Uncharacterized protein n=1 Tax=Caerostris darwini TaxID=1538125 RepID=A0AAV4QF16_9ARAC|nr:hypothetical protein CDAR_395121 [Caerostris darwini]
MFTSILQCSRTHYNVPERVTMFRSIFQRFVVYYNVSELSTTSENALQCFLAYYNAPDRITMFHSPTCFEHHQRNVISAESLNNNSPLLRTLIRRWPQIKAHIPSRSFSLCPKFRSSSEF